MFPLVEVVHAQYGHVERGICLVGRRGLGRVVGRKPPGMGVFRVSRAAVVEAALEH